MNDIIKNMDKLHTTKLGAERVRKNLQINTSDIVAFCKTRMLNTNATFEKSGKNWYIITKDCRITINANSYTIITAHKV